MPSHMCAQPRSGSALSLVSASPLSRRARRAAAAAACLGLARRLSVLFLNSDRGVRPRDIPHPRSGLDEIFTLSNCI